MTWTWLSEDPWPLAGTFLVLALIFLARLKFSQQGKDLARAGATIGAAGLIFLVEWLWVTDRERIEMAVYDMADAVKVGDFDRLEAYFAPEFDDQIGMISKAMLRGTLRSLDFEFVRVAQLEVRAGRLTRMGTAEFYGQAQWETTSDAFGSNYNATPPPGIGFSVGFREVDPNEWKVTRIDVTRTPAGVSPDSVAGYLGRFAMPR